MMMRGLFVVAVVLTCGSLALGGHIIGINFVGGDDPYTGPELGGTVTGTAGVVLQPNWNNMFGFDSGGPSAPLIDNTGVTTATTVEWAAPNVWNLGNLPDDGGSNSLMRGYLDNFWNLGTLTVRNVPFERYEVYVYGDSDRAVGTIDGYLLNGSFNSQQDRTEGGFTGDFVLGTDYVKFANLSIDGNGTDFTITAAQVDGNGAAPMSGIQVVDADLDLPQLTLTVDRDTGNMTLSNEEVLDQTFSGYAVLSGDGVILPDQWDPITGNGWSVTSSTVEDLSQDTTSDTTLGPGESIDLGNAWGTYYDEGDIKLQALSAIGVAAPGAVNYVGNNDDAFAFGDLNFDGVIDAADFEDVLRPGYGSDTTGLSIAEAYRLGDLDANMVIDETDALLLKQEIVAAGGSIAGLGIADVPEPSTLVLLGLGGLLCAVRRRVGLGRCLIVLVIANVFMAASMAGATSIGMNFVNTAAGGRDAAGGGALAPEDVAGEPSIAQANWNNAPVLPDGTANNGALTGLVDSDGATTTVNVTWASGNTWAAELAPTTPDQALMGGWLDDSGPGPTGGNLVEVRNVPYPVFDLYVYTNSDVGNDTGDRHPRIELDDAQGGVIQVLEGGLFEDPLSVQEDYFYDVHVNGNDGTTVNPSYLLFEDISLADFNITGDRMDDPDVRGAISGFQIVEETGLPNRLTLEVDRATGTTQIINRSGNSHEIDLYRVMSEAGSLDPAGWSSLEDQGINDDGTPDNGIGWETLGTASDVLSEIIIEGADGDDFLRFDDGDSVSLGGAFGGGAEDLVFQYHFPGSAAAQFVTGLVGYGGEGVLLGDVNLDQDVNGLDVDPFVDVLLNGPYQKEADMNQDTVVNGLDVDPFVEAVVGGGLQAVPEPSTLVLLGLALVGLIGYRRARS